MLPMYISTTNMVTPIATIKLETLYTNFINFMNISIYVLHIVSQTTLFIISEAYKEIIQFNFKSYENMIYIIGICNLFMLFLLDDQRKRMDQQKKQLIYLEEYIDFIRLSEKDRDHDEQFLIEKLNENTKKMTLLDKKIKKIEKDIKIYE
jgi:hypothetical protein